MMVLCLLLCIFLLLYYVGTMIVPKILNVYILPRRKFIIDAPPKLIEERNNDTVCCWQGLRE
jgi:hypothetical protein